MHLHDQGKSMVEWSSDSTVNTQNIIKPGYKKKFKQEVEKMKRQERKQYSKKQNRQKRKNNKG